MEKKSEEVSWNLSQALIMEIANLLSRASDYYVSRKYDCCFDCLKAIKLRISQHLDQTENEQFNSLESIILVNTTLSKPTGGFKPIGQKQKIAAGNVFKNLDKYNDLLMKCLKRYGYLIPQKEDSTKMNA